MNPNTDSTLQPLVIGEVLFDHFPDGKRILGGAPFNVAWNLAGFGFAPTFLSCVGDDDEGKEIKQRMDDWGLSTAALQTSSERATGKVQVEIVDGQPSYTIIDKQAFDFISPPDFPVSNETHSLVYSGSLALRNPTTRQSVLKLLAESNLPSFIDVNIRQPWFDIDWAGDLIRGATWVKLSEDELAFLTGWVWANDTPAEADVRQAVDKFRQQFFSGTAVATCIVTLGDRGACAIAADGKMHWAEPTVLSQGVEDTVGAGDAFVAATIYGLVNGWPLDRILAFASKFAAKVCTLRGATTTDRQHYLSEL